MLSDAGKVTVIKSDVDTDNLRAALDKLVLQHKPLCRGGKQNRDIGFYSDTCKAYDYSGTTMMAQPLTKWMHRLITYINDLTECDFNSLLINYYEDGSNYIGAHSDDSRWLANGTVASLSIGTTRLMRFRDLNKKIIEDIQLTDGDVLVMEDQDKYTHEIPKQLRVKEDRYSITFRKHL